MKKYLIALLLVVLHLPLLAQTVKKITIPDIEGFVTLKGDFHLHSVFSDGYVWPTIRIDEAVREGIDVIAITDHIEYRPHLSDVPSDHNRSYDIAKPYADKKGILLVKGSEITRSMPPGHFNALFVTDSPALAKDDFKAVMKEVKKQGGFVIWNHPGWKAQQPDTTKWFEMHTWLYENGILNGIEIYNEKEYYPVVFDWALQKKLTIFANSDSHIPTAMNYDLVNSHRPVTLVFAKGRTEADVKDALFEGRTVSFAENSVRGRQEWLNPLFWACIKQYPKAGKVEFINVSGIDLVIEYNTDKLLKTIILSEGKNTTFMKGTVLKIKNFETAPGKSLEVIVE